MRVLALVLPLCFTAPRGAAATEFVHQGDTYVLRGDLAAGKLDITSPSGIPLVGVTPLAGLTFTDGSRVASSQMTSEPDPGDPRRIKLSSPQAELTLALATGRDRIAFDGEVLCKRGTVMHVAVPHTFQLTGKPRKRFLWPSILGCELSESFLASGKSIFEDYPPAFCDFCAADIGGTTVFFYRCEGEERPHSTSLLLRGSDPPVFRRWYRTYVREGERWPLPAFACQIGGDLRQTLLRYKRECGLGKPLEEKMTPGFRAKWAAMALASAPSQFGDASQVVQDLPLPAALELNDWMLGGFDRKYPDFLPPNPAFGGEEGFRELIRVAHQHGHLVRPYVNFTWWCTGWEGPGSQPAPSYEKHGDIALSRKLNGELIYENYNGNYGYCVCPAHPVAVQRRLAVRDALLDDYGVDSLYEDQLGARTWPLDLNPALDNPADYGWALMRIGSEDAARCPVETEFGNDQVLSFACALNYWTLDPLSPVHTFPGQPPPQWSEDERRSFPYGLFLSSGDAVVSIPRCGEPDRLAWAMLLGGRVSLGTVRETVRVGPHREQVHFLQLLAKSLAQRAIGDRLTEFEYLAPRVARSAFEQHEVVANFSQGLWIQKDGTRIAPDGFDLQARDGFRAGRYLAASGEPVSVMIEPTQNQATFLATCPFEVSVGRYVVRSEGPQRQRTVTGRRTAVADFGPGLGGISSGGLTADSLVEAFSALSPSRLRSPGELARDLDALRVLVNSHGEHLVAEKLSEWPQALERLRTWCESGGILVEIGGWPLWTAAAPGDGPGQWAKKRIGAAGFHAVCGARCQTKQAPNPPRRTLRVTEAGRAVLSEDTARALQGTTALVTRPPASLEDAIVLCDSDEGAYLVVHSVGYGAVVRVGGVPGGPVPKALAEIVASVLDDRLDLGAPVWREEMGSGTLRRQGS